MPIRVLPQHLINQIAAGEVVVNMAATVKELVENAIDAGATSIRVEIANDVRDVTVIDDGCGMDADDAEMCLQRHATSKIRTHDDLFELTTRGFRGEAVPSIASVSRMELRTRPHEALAGTRIVVEGGGIERIEEVGCPAGTRFDIRDLFFNTPARRKFVKSPTSEMNAVVRTVVRQALAAHATGFQLVRDGETRLDLPVGQSLADRFRSILGTRGDGGLLELDALRDSVRVRGFMVHPNDSHGDRRHQYLFVNGRPFGNRAISAAIEQACRGFLMKGRYPKFCLFVEVPAGAVDINVHPNKEEVRFQNERSIAGTCHRAVLDALEGTPNVPEWNIEGGSEGRGTEAAAPSTERTSPPQDHSARNVDSSVPATPMALVERAFDRKRERDPVRVQQDLVGLYLDHPTVRAPSDAGSDRHSLDRTSADNASEGRVRPVAAAPGERPETEFWNRPYEPEPLGQIAETYIVARFGDDVLVIDQHAAHERLRYLELKDRTRDSVSQSLLVPQTVDPGAAGRAALESLLPALAEIGFELEPFGGTTFLIHSVPADLVALDAGRLVLEFLEDSEEEGVRPDAVEEVRDRLLIRAACHSSIRAGNRLRHEEMVELLRLMRRHRLSFTCPHGRPTIVRLSKDRLDRQFGRLGA